jgi:hypothetical protein
MTKRNNEKLDVAVRFGWNSACQEILWWIEDMREEDDLSRKQKRILLELESHLNIMHDLWRGKNADN